MPFVLLRVVSDKHKISVLTSMEIIWDHGVCAVELDHSLRIFVNHCT
jgi:hypothetical protein